MNRDEHKKFLQQQILQIKANICDSKLNVEAEELKQQQLTQNLYAVGGALEALAKEEEEEKEAPELDERKELIRALKGNMEHAHTLPPHVIEAAETEAKKRATKVKT